MQQQLKKLITQKDTIESELATLTAQISSLNQAKGFDKSLVDEEGFPRADLDFGQLAQYRTMKRRKAQLNNDHVQIMKDIEKGLWNLHSGYQETGEKTLQMKAEEQREFRKGAKVGFGEQKQTQPKSIEKLQQSKIDYLTPFAIISVVTEGSPAWIGGIKPNDLLSEFHQINIYSVNAIKEIPKYVKQSIPIKIVLMRETQDQQSKSENVFLLKNNKRYRKIVCQLTPKRWEGPGLLGCKIDPLPKVQA